MIHNYEIPWKVDGYSIVPINLPKETIPLYFTKEGGKVYLLAKAKLLGTGEWEEQRFLILETNRIIDDFIEEFDYINSIKKDGKHYHFFVEKD